MSEPADLARLLRRVDTVQPRSEFEQRIAEGRPLRVKLGLDPTAPAVTLGWAVVLRKLRDFQEQGHTAVLIVGDFTAQVGDPSLRSETRKRLTADEVSEFAGQVLSQFEKVLLPEPLEVRYNSEWLAALDMPEILELTSTATVAQLLERGDFAKRFEANSPISVMEFMYPLLQGYDSVAVQADVELGGSDQLWNLMMGRAIQERYGQRAQVAMTMPLLIGTDGSQKMSQSLGNYIGVTEPAEEIFGKTMSIPDRLMPQWFELATELPADEVQRVLSGVGDETIHPRAAKELLAKSITELYRGPVEAERAAADFQRVFSNRDVPDRIETFPLPPEDPVALPQFFREAGVVKSAAEARRLLAQGAIEVNGATMTADQIPRNELAGALVKVGKRRFLRVGGIEPTL
ncbi:MAG TPA: tyrosine--tRNA ligase [Acidimicrobiia bacterium]|jgi:tyrosyl-tRNA synthetase